MKLIKPSYEIWEQGKELSGVVAQIERAARVCYASEPKGEVGELLGKLIKAKHYAMLEHGTVYLYSTDSFAGGYHALLKYKNNHYSKVNTCHNFMTKTDRIYVTTNYRVLVENGWLDDLKFLVEPTEYHEKRITVKFTMDRIGSQSFCRHRVFSFAQESTRYCNYSKDKFGNEVTFIQPCWDYIKTAAYNGVDHFDGDYFEHSLREAESYYFKLLDLGWKPQQARQVLPNALKTELVMTGFVSDWKHFFDLRAIGTTGKPHPDAEVLAKPLMDELIERRYLNGTSNS